MSNVIMSKVHRPSGRFSKAAYAADRDVQSRIWSVRRIQRPLTFDFLTFDSLNQA